MACILNSLHLISIILQIVNVYSAAKTFGSNLHLDHVLFRKDILLNDSPTSNKVEGCPIITKNVDESIQLIADCDEGTSLAQYILENTPGKIATKQSIPSVSTLKFGKMSKGLLDEENLNFKSLLLSNKGIKFSGVALNTIHFADGNLAISDIKINNLEYPKGASEFVDIKLTMQGIVEINGDQIPILLEKKSGKSVFDVKITNVQAVTIEELATTFKASVENILTMSYNNKFKTTELKAVSLSNPTIIGKLTIDGSMQLVANSEASDDNLYFAHENLFVVINKKRSENPKLAIVFNIGKGKSIDDLFSSIMKNQSRSFSCPIVGKFSSNDWALSFSEANNIAVATPEQMLLPFGINARIELSKSELDKVCKDLLNGDYSTGAFEIQLYHDGRYMLKPAANFHPNIENFLECLSPESKQKVDLPEELINKCNFNRMNISLLFFNPHVSGGYDLKFTLSCDISIFNGVMQFSEFVVQIKKTVDSWFISATSHATLPNLEKRSEAVLHDVTVTLEYMTSSLTNETIIEANFPDLSLSNLLAVMNIDRDNFHLTSTFSELLDIGLTNVEYTWLSDPVRFSGDSHWLGFPAKVSGISWFDIASNDLKTEKQKNTNTLTNNKLPKKEEATKPKTQKVPSKENKSINNSTDSHQGKKKEFKKIEEIKNKNEKVAVKVGEEKSIDKKNNRRNNEIHHLFRPSFYNNSLLKSYQENEFKNNEESGDYDYIQDTQSSGFFNLGDSLKKVMSVKIDNFKPKPPLSKAALSSVKSSSDVMTNVDDISKGESDSGQVTDYTGDSRSFKKLYYALNMKRENKNIKQFNKGASPIRSRANVPEANFLPMMNNIPMINNNYIHSNGFDKYLDFGGYNHFYPSYPEIYASQRFLRDSITSPSNDQLWNTVIQIAIGNPKLSNVLYLFYGKKIMTSSWIVDTKITLIISNTDSILPESYRNKEKHFNENKRMNVEGNFGKHSFLFSKYFNQKSCYSSDDDVLYNENIRDTFADTNKRCKSSDIRIDEMFWKQLKKGMSISCVFPVPSICKNNKLCEWIKQRMHDEEKINFLGYLTNSQATIYGQLELLDSANTEDFIIDKAILIFTYNENDIESSGLHLKIEVTLRRPIAIPLIGFIYEGASGNLLARLQPQKSKTRVPFLMMINPWFHDLYTKEVMAYASIDPQLKSFPSIDLISYIKLGKPKDDGTSDEHLISFKAILTFSASDPSNNYLSGDITDLTMQSLATAFAYENNLPKFLMNAVFPNGAKFFYTNNSTSGVSNENPETHANSAYQISGDIKVFEFFTPAELKLLSGKMEVSVQLPPFEIMNGLVQFGYSHDDFAQGPTLNCVIGIDVSDVTMHGNVQTMGLSSTINAKFNQENVQFNMSGLIFDSLLMDVMFKGKLFTHLMNIEFQVSGCVQKEDLIQIEKDLLTHLEKESSIGVLYKQKVDNNLKVVNQGLINAKTQISNWKTRLQIYNDQLKQKSEDVKKTKYELKKSCVNECPDVCVPFFGWDQGCFKIWGNLLGCPGWENCKWKVKDIICIATCELEKIGKKLTSWSDTLGMRAILGLSEMGSSLINSIEGFLKNYKALYEHVEKVHETITTKTSTSFQIKQILDTTESLTSAVKINELCGSTFLNKEWYPSMNFEFDGQLGNKSVKWKDRLNFNLNLRNKIRRKTIKTRFSISDDDEISLDDQTKTFFIHVKEQQQVLETMKSELQMNIDNFLIGKTATKKQNDGKGLRGFVSQRESNYHDNAADEFLSYDTKNSDTMKAYYLASPWHLVENFSYEMSNIPLSMGAEDTTPVERSLDTCSQMRHVVEKYDKLTQGMKRFSASTEKQRLNYVATKKSYLNELQKMAKKVSQIENSRSFSITDLEDLRFWHDSVRDGLEKWNAMSESIYLDGQRRGLAAFKNQMDLILKRQKETNVRDYVVQLHDKGMEAYKRSHFPNYTSIKGGIFLGEIKKSILDLYNDVDSPLQEFTAKISKTEQKIDQLKRYMKSCNFRK